MSRKGAGVSCCTGRAIVAHVLLRTYRLAGRRAVRPKSGRLTLLKSKSASARFRVFLFLSCGT